MRNERKREIKKEKKEKEREIFIIVRVIRHRGIRDDDNKGDAVRPREIIRLAATIIDHHSESHRKGYIKK